MGTHFRVGAVAYSRPLYTHPNVLTAVEKAHAILANTRGPITLRENSSKFDGTLHLRRLTASPDVEATYEWNINRPPSSVIPDWARQAVSHLATLRTVTTVGLLDVGRQE
jgi:hypothetical protein